MLSVVIASVVLLLNNEGCEGLEFLNVWIWKVKESDPIGSLISPRFSNKPVQLVAGGTGREHARFGVKGVIGERYFTVEERTGIVKLKAQFDREVQDQYRAMFYVKSGKVMVEAEAEIKVIDVNDNAPIFEKHPYNKAIPETWPVEKKVVHVRAIDLDSGNGGRVEYSLEGDDRVPFILESQTGVIRLAAPLDYEVTQVYQFKVRASDLGRPSLSSVAEVIIRVEDVQDTKPVFLGLPYDRSVPEDTPEGSKLLRLRAEDGDKGKKNAVWLSIVSGDDGGQFIITGQDLRVAKAFDRDAAGFDGVYSLTVRAQEYHGNASSYTDVTFDVTVTDIDDNKPAWEDNYREINVSEDTRIGTRLLTLRVKDRDQGLNSDLAVFIDREFSATFAVSPALIHGEANVALILNDKLDFEERRKFIVKIFANETLNSTHYAVCDVTVNVENVNDNRPFFEKTIYRVEVLENATKSTKLVSVRARDDDDGEFGEMTYAIKDTEGMFAIDTKTGEVELWGELDREKKDQYSVIVSASDGGMPAATASVLIFVADVNDNLPHFGAASYVAEVGENEVPSEPIAIIWASDHDASPSNEITYDITKSHLSRHFKVKKTKEGYGEVFMRTPLDFELLQHGMAKVELVATDSGIPPRNSTASLVVKVADVNDNAPIFSSRTPIKFSISEKSRGGQFVGFVHATDGDVGRNGKIRYFAAGNADFDLAFQLDEFTGNITIKSGTSLDYETIEQYDVTIVAEDHGSPPNQALHKLQIFVQDANDNAPVFNSNRYYVTFEENTIPPIIIQVTAQDNDSGANAEVRYAIAQGNEDEIFEINSTSGVISALSPLDFESSRGRYILAVTACDQPIDHEAKLNGATQVTINIIDVNDNAPVFKLHDNDVTGLLSYDVIEGLEGVWITEFSSSDADQGRNRDVSFSICKGNDEDLFEISHTGGVLRVKKERSLDRETTSVHRLTICATDGGQPSMKSTVLVRVKVTDVNDNAPQFVELNHKIHVREDTKIATAVARISAFDRDEGDNGRLYYELTEEDNAGVFYIDRSSGEIILAKPLDREAVESYELQVKARDSPESSSGSKFTTRRMKVIVSDVNDNSPMFMGNTPYQGQIPENLPVGSEVQVIDDLVLATDSDSGQNAIVTYEIVHHDVTVANASEGTEKKLFRINSKTGTISALIQFDRESLMRDVITLVIRARDNGGRYSDATMQIYVIDENDNPPRFRRKEEKAKVKEDVMPGKEVIRLVATDEDSGRNAQVTYHIVGGAFDQFNIDQSTGILRVTQYLDRERRDFYNITVVAIDNGVVTSLSSNCTVLIQIDDVNDSRPRFDDVRIEAKVKENSKAGFVIAQVRASDEDQNARLEYRIARVDAFDARGRPISARRGGNIVYDEIKSWFTINATTGLLTTSRAKQRIIDRELCSKVQMSISLTDLNSVKEEDANALYDADVSITIDDDNDNKPIFVTSDAVSDITELGAEVIANVTEEQTVGSEIFKVQAIDEDAGNNGKVVYDVMNGHYVEIRNENEGTLQVTSRIDRESLQEEHGHAWINVTMTATDLGEPKGQWSNLKIAFRIIDINDNDPELNKEHYRISVREDTRVGSAIETATASDEDSGNYGKVFYSLKGGARVFSIDRDSGAIILRRPLDREITSSYRFVIVATDNEKGAESDRRSASAPVTVAVVDVNDCPPVFVEPREPTTYSTREDAGVGSFIAAVSAEDPDQDSQITFSLRPSIVSNFFKILPSGHIKISHTLTDLPRHLATPQLEVVATDGGGLSSNVTLTLDIVDVNDHAPIFEHPEGRDFYIKEEEQAGTYVGQVTATDSDSGLNGIVRYSVCDIIHGTVNFAIDEVTGRIVTTRRLDREKMASYNVQFCAKDLGSRPLKSEINVAVHLTDINDNYPEFPESSRDDKGAHQTIPVAENLEVGKPIGYVISAIDHDEEGNSEVFYHILSITSSGIDVGHMFDLDKKTGNIYLQKPLNREMIDRYKMVVMATNFDQKLRVKGRGKQKWERESEEMTELPAPNSLRKLHRLLSMKSYEKLRLAADKNLIEVTIVIDDVNDEPPVFEKTKYVTAVNADVDTGHRIIMVKATDADLHDSVDYHIINAELFSNENKTIRSAYAAFEIDPQDGAITTARNLKGYNGRFFKLEIGAIDKERHRASTTVLLLLLRKDDNIVLTISNPPPTVQAKRNELVNLLESITKLQVVIDDIGAHVISGGRHDNDRTDVTMKVYNLERMTNMVMVDFKRKLESSEMKVEGLFESCVPAVQSNPSVGSPSFQVIVVILLALIILIIALFIVMYYHMQRRYKRQIKVLATGTSQRQSQDVTPETEISDRSETLPHVIFPKWKEEYYKVLSSQKITEEADYFTDSDKEVVRYSTSKKRPKSSASYRSSTESSSRRKIDSSMSRSKTDASIPHSQKRPNERSSVSSAREGRRQKSCRVIESIGGLDKKQGMGTKTKRRSPNGTSSGEGANCPSKHNRKPPRHDKLQKTVTQTEDYVSSTKESALLEHDSSFSRNSKSDDSRSDASTVREIVTKERDENRRRGKGHQSPELSLHSGGTSEEYSRQLSIALHGSDASELENDYFDSDDVTNSNIETTT